MSIQDFSQHVRTAFGETLSDRELTDCLKAIDLVEPSLGQRLWDNQSPAAGVYIILSGKARLIDQTGDLAGSLWPGETFGETALFSADPWQPHTVRAGQGVLLGHLPQTSLVQLLQSNPPVRDGFYKSAIRRDVLLRFARHSLFQTLSRSQIWALLQQAHIETLAVGSTIDGNPNSPSLWLVQGGEIQNSSGTRLSAGDLYEANGTPSSWHVVAPTRLLRLSIADLERMQSAASPQIAAIAPPIALKSTAQAAASRRETFSALVGVQDRATPSAASPKTYFPSPTLKLGHWWQQLSQRYPFVKQQSRKDCGAACLAMVGRYWGKRFSINQLRQLANVNRRGSSLQGIVIAAETLGFSPRPVKGTLEGLANQALPAIAHWEGNHYIVVYAVTRRRVMVSDPALGRRNLSREAFCQGWTGYTLLLQPTAALKQAPEAQADLWRFIELIKPYGGVFLEVLLASLLIQLFGLCMPIMTQVLLDQVVAQRSVSTFYAAGSGLLIFSLFSILMRSLRRYLLFHTANRIDLSLAVGFIAHAFRLPQRYFDTRFVGDITSRVDENRTIRRFLSSDALLTLIDLLMVFVYFGLMFWYSWPLALAAATLFPVLAIVTLITTPFLKRVSREIFTAKTIEGNYLIEALTGIATVKALGIERLVRWRWEELFNHSIKTNFTGQLVRERIGLTNNVLESVGTRLIFLFGVWQVIHDQLSVGQLFAFNMLLGNVFSPFQRLTSLWNDFQEVLIAVERLNDVLNSPPEEDEQALQLPPLPPIRGHLRFEGVIFRYDPDSDRNTLENISFEVLPGQTVALVGRSGSGKTTLAKLLLGLYPTTQGRILIDDHDLNSIAKPSLRRQTGVVDQDTFLFGGTIRENISIGHPGATLEEIREAARQAGADLFINEFPLKYETPIGEGGGMLSGGQRQRLAIARALIGNPRLLILDEATSNLDTESERIIQTSLNTILKNRTTLVIAHRLSTIRNADLIVVLDRGILVEQGTHTELMAKRGQYFYLNQQQLSTVV
ncbi:MAG: cysteine peptidase family C39 domain-containing protein [Thermosynechococcaceae cyanobacterium]